MLRPFLSLVHDDPQTAALARDGGDVFVATSLRPYLVAALPDEGLAPGRPAPVGAGGRRRAPGGGPPPTARRWWWRATPARRAISPTTSRRGSRRGPSASTRAAASR